MLKPTQCKKDSKSQYDPQVGRAAQANVALAERAQAWTEEFYEKTLSPMLDEMAKATRANTERQGELFDLNMDQARLQEQRYRSLGIPAEDRYYKMVDEYSAPEEQERQATAAIGDQRTAAAGQRGALMRRFQGLGIDPTSPAALSAMTDMAVNDAAMEAAAATRARQGAKALGMALTADAANFGRGGASGALQFGAAASGNAGAAASGAQSGVGSAAGGAAPMQAAWGVGTRAYGANLDAYTNLRRSEMEQEAAGAAGLGQLLGVIGSAAITKSDRRLKKNVQKVATLAHGIGVWVFNYLWEPEGAPRRVGYMADEVQPVFPEAVHVDPSGFLAVDYSKVRV